VWIYGTMCTRASCDSRLPSCSFLSAFASQRRRCWPSVPSISRYPHASPFCPADSLSFAVCIAHPGGKALIYLRDQVNATTPPTREPLECIPIFIPIFISPSLLSVRTRVPICFSVCPIEELSRVITSSLRFR